jgi:hypothetical protein
LIVLIVWQSVSRLLDAPPSRSHGTACVHVYVSGDEVGF